MSNNVLNAAGEPVATVRHQYAIGRDDSYASWKTRADAQMAVFTGLRRLLASAFASGKKPDIVVCHGSSSVFAVVPLIPFLAEHGVAVFHLRKEGENAHGQEFEGPRMVRDPDEGNFKAWFIDDGVASGATIRRVRGALSRYNTDLETVILYADTWGGDCGVGVRVVRRYFLPRDAEASNTMSRTDARYREHLRARWFFLRGDYKLRCQ